MTTFRNDARPKYRAARILSAVAAFAALAGLIAPQTAHAGTSTAGTDWMNISPIRVKAAPGGGYTGVPSATMSWEAEFHIDTEGIARIKAWSIYPRLSTDGHPGLEGIADIALTSYKVSETYGIGDRPRDHHDTVAKLFPSSAVSDFATQVCNRNMQNLVVGGELTEHQVFAVERPLTVSLVSGLGFSVTTGQTITGILVRELEIVCEAAPFVPLPPGPGGITTEDHFQVVEADLQLSPDDYSGNCPKDLTLDMTIKSQQAGDFEVRVESNKGWQSQEAVFATNQFEENTGLWIRTLSESLEIPGNYTSGGIGGYASGPQSPNVHQGQFRVVAGGGGNTVVSPWRAYHFVCAPDDKATPPAPDTKPDTNDAPAQPTEPAGTRDNDALASPSLGATTQSNDDDDKKDRNGNRGNGGKGRRPQTPAPSQSTPAPSSTPQPQPSAQAATALPDLRVLDARAARGGRPGVEFLVENAGRQDARPTQARVLCATAPTRSQIWQAAVPGVPAGSKQWVRGLRTGSRTVAQRARGCTIRLDAPDALRESNERNNEYGCPACATPAKR